MFCKTLARNLKRDALAVLLVGFTLYFVGIHAEMTRDVDPAMHKHVQSVTWQTTDHFLRHRH